ncbi:MAG: RtcB family protein [Candidatus Omnitrophica bacterium]|nr:RtcB family protein [Candidatus Omnitrophota bacterium]MBU1048012.1 RtcB family protein [Candidatus Omnitrophota bacterium]MBU1630436.1 RtcB family protein [Candidatus Omnitrophota bacterium]MBU1767527.1 RtcB family protein [Candidatus Omnitrophota bacterium]MBU1889382.1 RtcB family protein [Candidatus Omnitrophota bacterium]
MANLKKIDDYRWEIPKGYVEGMRVSGIIYSNEKMMQSLEKEQVMKQVANVACLPGIVKHSFAMPDAHWGYGFAIGGVAATDPEQGGVISPGGVGYDINCGIRLLKTNLKTEDIKNKIPALMDALFTNIPCGVGIGGKIKVSPQQEKELLKDGSKWAVKQGYGVEDDIINTEEGGCLQSANPDKVSPRAYERGKNQSGTLGSGNHFLEIQKIDEIYDEQKAKVFGIEKDQITIMIHSGSRGLGHQICDDSLRIMQKVVSKYGIKLPDRQLVSVPIDSPEGKDYFSAMASAANYAWCNRQILMHLVRETFGKFFGKKWQDLGMELIYDVAHNIAKLEKHKVNGKETLLCVHRKGATRAFPPNHPDIPLKYKSIGQPVIIPGDMGRASYLLAGTQKAFEETWGSTCHGAGRTMSRHKAIKIAEGRSIFREMEEKGITVRARNKNTLAEEMSEAYKDINMVVDIVHKAGISQKVAKMKPLGVIKG